MNPDIFSEEDRRFILSITGYPVLHEDELEALLKEQEEE